MLTSRCGCLFPPFRLQVLHWPVADALLEGDHLGALSVGAFPESCLPGLSLTPRL